MNLGNLLFNALKTGAELFAIFKGKKPSLPELLPTVMGKIIEAVGGVVESKGFTTKEQVDQWIGFLDAQTGADLGALDLFPSLPPDKEEEMLDGLLQVVRVYAYNKAGVPGYRQ
jgi:hypothetical protein